MAEASLVQTDDSQRPPCPPVPAFSFKGPTMSLVSQVSRLQPPTGGEHPLCLVLGLKPAGGGGRPPRQPLHRAGSRRRVPAGPEGAHVRRGGCTQPQAAFPLTRQAKGCGIRQAGRVPHSSWGWCSMALPPLSKTLNFPSEHPSSPGATQPPRLHRQLPVAAGTPPSSHGDGPRVSTGPEPGSVGSFLGNLERG